MFWVECQTWPCTRRARGSPCLVWSEIFLFHFLRPPVVYYIRIVYLINDFAWRNDILRTATKTMTTSPPPPPPPMKLPVKQVTCDWIRKRHRRFFPPHFFAIELSSSAGCPLVVTPFVRGHIRIMAESPPDRVQHTLRAYTYTRACGCVYL